VVARVAQDAFRQLESTSDVLDAEQYVSGLLGTWWGRPESPADPEVLLGEGIVAYAARRPRAGAVGLLRAIAVLGTAQQREQAAAAADALTAGGTDGPAWVQDLGTERVTAAWEYGDVFGDATGVLLVAERAGARHGVVVLVDHTLGGMVTDALITDEPDEVLEDLRGDTGTPDPRAITTDAAAALLVPAFEATDTTARAGAGPEVDEEFAASRALVLARVQLLPAPPPAPPVVGLDAAARTAAVDDFLGSAEARDLPPGARGCAELLVEFGEVVDPARPLRVGPGLIDRFLDAVLNDETLNDGTLDEGPELSDEELDALPATLRAWAEWAGRRSGLPEEAMAELREAVDDMACAIGRPGDPEPLAGDVADAFLAGLDLDELGPQDLVEVLERRMFAIPAVGARIGEEEFPFLDPSDPDDRGMFIEGEHPEFHEALADPDPEPVDGVNPRLHITMHEIIANQLWDDEPKEVWQAARRLSAAGHDRHDVLHAIGEVLARHLHGALTGSGAFDAARYAEEIDGLGRAEEDRVVVPMRRKR
jgi:hypothetical protein